MPGYRILKRKKKDLTDEVVDYQYNKDNNMEKSKWYNSSANPQDLSITIRGLLLAWIPMIIVIGQFFNIPLTTESLTELIQLVTGLISAFMIVGGFIRKIYFWFENK